MGLLLILSGAIFDEDVILISWRLFAGTSDRVKEQCQQAGQVDSAGPSFRSRPGLHLYFLKF